MSGQLISPSLPTFLTTCEECGGALTHNPDSLIVCRACGLVHKPIIVDSQLNSALEPDACHRERANRAWVADDLGSSMGHRHRSSRLLRVREKSLSAEKHRAFQRQKNLNEKYLELTNKKKQLRYALRILRDLVNCLELSQTIHNDAALILRKVPKKKGFYVAELAAASIYLTMRKSPHFSFSLKHLFEGCQAAGYTVRQKKIVEAAGILRQQVETSFYIQKPSSFFERIFLTITQDPTVLRLLHSQPLPPSFFQLLRQVYRTVLQHFDAPTKRPGCRMYEFAVAILIGAEIAVTKYLTDRKTGFFTQSLLAKIFRINEWTLRNSYLKRVKPLLSDINKGVKKLQRTIKKHLVPPQSSASSQIPFQDAVTTIQSFFTKHGRAPRTHECSSLYYRLRKGFYSAQGITTWADLLGSALPEATFHNRYGGKRGLQRAIFDVRAFIRRHRRPPQKSDLARLYYAFRVRRWPIATWADLLTKATLGGCEA